MATSKAALITCLCAWTAVHAETLELFKASRHGDLAWAWGDARVKRKGLNLVFMEHNARGSYGDAYTADRFPYFRDGVVEVDVAQVTAGQYVVQMLGFSKGQHVATADLIASSLQTGKKTFRVGDFYMPGGVDEVSFKVWVELQEGASVAIKDIFYYVTIKETEIAHDDDFRDADVWVPENLEVRAVAGRNALVLGQDVSLGSILGTNRYSLGEVDSLLLSVLTTKNGGVSVQLPVFDGQGTYVDSIDLLRDVGPGLYLRHIGDIEWPSLADSFEIKIWLSGTRAATVLDRLVVLRKVDDEAVSARAHESRAENRDHIASPAEPAPI